jgi:guanine deaminase
MPGDVVPRLLRGAYVSCSGDPFADPDAMLRHESDGVVAITNGVIVDAGAAGEVLARFPPGTPVEQLPSRSLLAPGFVDCHVHYGQLGVIASYGTQLLDWLERYTFPAEAALADADVARAAARLFFDSTLACGTTTTATFCTVHPVSVDAYFDEALARGVRTIAGKVLMDRHAPAALTDDSQRGYDESKALIERWHGRERLGFAITPRFAPTSSPEQLEAAGALWREHPTCTVQSHVAENTRELAWVRELFPDARDYVDVYARFGLVGPRAIYGHGIHLTDRELAELHDTGTAIAHCPTSNLFLGSGLFPWARMKRRDRAVRVGLGTDVGGGTSLSMLATLAEAYKVAQLGGTSLSATHLLHLATRGGAQALGVDDRVGAIEPGMEADLVVLDLAATPMLAQRVERAATIDEALFALMMLGDDRAVRTTFVGGREAHVRPA